MGIGRREFLKFTSLALAGALIDPGQLIFANGDYYVNKELGLGFRKPKVWEFEALSGFPYLDRRQILSNLDEDESQALIEDHMDTLVAAMTKYSDAIGKFGPCITIYRNFVDYKIHKSDMVGMAEEWMQDMSLALRDYEYIDLPKNIMVSNCKAMRLKGRYIFEQIRIKPTLIEDEIIGIEHQDSFYTIHLYDSPHTGEVAHKEFDIFKRSLHLI